MGDIFNLTVKNLANYGNISGEVPKRTGKHIEYLFYFGLQITDINRYPIEGADDASITALTSAALIEAEEKNLLIATAKQDTELKKAETKKLVRITEGKGEAGYLKEISDKTAEFLKKVKAVHTPEEYIEWLRLESAKALKDVGVYAPSFGGSPAGTKIAVSGFKSPEPKKEEVEP